MFRNTNRRLVKHFSFKKHTFMLLRFCSSKTLFENVSSVKTHSGYIWRCPLFETPNETKARKNSFQAFYATLLLCGKMRPLSNSNKKVFRIFHFFLARVYFVRPYPDGVRSFARLPNGERTRGRPFGGAGLFFSVSQM